MPRERILHGAIHVDEPNMEPTNVVDSHGQPSGLKAYAVRLLVPGEELPPGTKVTEQPSLDVTWNREPAGWVQVSIDAPNGWWKDFNESREDSENMVSHYGVYTEVLNRQQINNMIKTLRRARDAAYGTDE